MQRAGAGLSAACVLMEDAAEAIAAAALRAIGAYLHQFELLLNTSSSTTLAGVCAAEYARFSAGDTSSVAQESAEAALLLLQRWHASRELLSGVREAVSSSCAAQTECRTLIGLPQV